MEGYCVHFNLLTGGRQRGITGKFSSVRTAKAPADRYPVAFSYHVMNGYVQIRECGEEPTRNDLDVRLPISIWHWQARVVMAVICCQNVPDLIGAVVVRCSPLCAYDSQVLFGHRSLLS